LSLKEKIDRIFDVDADAADESAVAKPLAEVQVDASTEASALLMEHSDIDIYAASLRTLRDSTEFTIIVTVTILIVGIVNGVETDLMLRCARLDLRTKGRDDDEASAPEQMCNEPFMASVIIAYISQVIFTVEMLVKVGVEGRRPLRYYTDEENGAWNMLDSFIVFVGFVEMTPLEYLVASFPVVIFRLLRLLRVFRLAKALPRLRSIVEALISGFSAVGWICVLIVVFNYIKPAWAC